MNYQSNFSISKVLSETICQFLTLKNSKVYLPVAKQLDQPPPNWREVAFLDKRLTEKWLNSYDVVAPCFCLDDEAEQSSCKDLENFLGAEYRKVYGGLILVKLVTLEV